MENSHRFRAIFAEWVRALYLAAPVSTRLKLRIKALLFGAFSPLLRHTRAYRAWRAFESEGRGLAQGGAGQATALGTTMDGASWDVPAYFCEHYGAETARRLWAIAETYGIVPTATGVPSAEPVSEDAAEGWIERLNLLLERAPLGHAPEASVIIPIFNQARHTLACLESVLSWETETAFEVIVADDCSTDAILQRVLASLKGVRVVRTEANSGFVRNCNHAARRAHGEYLLFLNNDTLVLPGWLDALVAVFTSHPDAGMVGSKFLYPDGTVQEAGGILWSDATASNYGRGRDPRAAELNHVRETDYCTGASIMVRSALFEQLGGFDEHYAPAYCEDSDLAFRVRERGFKVYYQPFSEVIHFESVSSGPDLMSGARRYQEINIAKLVQRWRVVLQREHFDPNEYPFLARDRSSDRAHLLIIDQSVPRFDRDAGSRTIFQYARLLSREGFGVSFWPDDGDSSPPYARALQSLGVEVLYRGYGTPGFEDWIRQHGMFFDYVLLSRPEIALKYARLVRENSPAKVLYYGHDLHHARFAREHALTASPGVRQRQKQATAQELAAWQAADVVLYPSDEERDIAAGHALGKTVLHIPAYYFEAEPPPIDLSDRMGLLFVGSFKHTPNVDGLRWFLAEVWPRLRELTPGMPLFVVGADPPDDIQRLASDWIRLLGYVRDDELARLYRAARVAVAPLRVGAGVKGKVVESLWHGLPIATTSVGAQGLSGVTRFLQPCDQPEELAKRIMCLATDANEWTSSAQGGQEYVKQQFSAAAVVGALAGVIPELAAASET